MRGPAILLFVLVLVLSLPGARSASAQRCVDEVCVDTETAGDVVHFYVDNRREDTLAVSFELDLDNMMASVKTPYTGVFPGRARTRAFSLRKRNAALAMQFGYRFRWRPALLRKRYCVDGVLCVVSEQYADTLHFYVENLTAGDVSLVLSAEMENMRSAARFPFRATFPAGRRRAFSAYVVDPFKGWKSPYSFEWAFGRLEAYHDERYAYALPYAPGAEYRVVQGYGGRFTHVGKQALDFEMPEGTPVHAAREGVVVEVRDTNAAGGLDESLKTKDNYVLVEHPDGTLAVYAHLRKGGSAVAAGTRVARGQLIAYSGNTGYSSGPHLHFEVFRLARDLTRETIPVRFRIGSRSIGLEEQERYRATR